MRPRAVLLCSLLLTACAPKIFVPEPAIPGKGFVYVYRPGGFGWALSPMGVLNSTNPPMTRTFPIRADKYVVTPMDPGPITLVSSGPDNKPISLAADVAADALTFIRCDMKMGWLIGGLQCRVVPPDQGQHDVARVKRNDRGD